MKRERARVVDGEVLEASKSGGISISALLDAVEQESPADPCIPGVVTGTLVGIEQSGAPLVDFPGNPLGHGVIARSTVKVGDIEIGGDVALMFENGNPRRPLLIGPIQNCGGSGKAAGKRVTAIVDGERVVVTAENELVLRCGDASITLTRAGKILIRGNYLLSRSSGMNRIRGASVELN
jgi:hypothetical protein